MTEAVRFFVHKSKINRILLFVLISIFISGSISCIDRNYSNIPARFRPYISQKTTAVPYRPVFPFYDRNRESMPETISQSQAMEDIEMLEYLFSTAYSGYEFWEKKGVDFTSFFEKLRNDIRALDSIPTITLEQNIAKLLEELSDGHIAIIGHGYNHALGHASVYFANVVVEKTNRGQFKVIHSQNDKVRTGDFFTEPKPDNFLFPTLSPTGKQHFLIGILSYDFVTGYELSFNNRKRLISFYENRMIYAKQKDPEIFHIKSMDNIPVISVRSFANQYYSVMQKFMNAGHQFKEEKTLIIDVLNNGGGSSLFPSSFIRNLNGALNWKTDWGNLTSPAITEFYAKYDTSGSDNFSPDHRNMINHFAGNFERFRSSPVKEWEFTAAGHYPMKGNFEGKLLVVANRRTISAGEAMVGTSASVSNRILIGENTGGVAQFSSTCSYYLPHSKIIAKLPRQIIFIPDLKETIGYLPDYWIDTDNPIAEIMKWVNHPDQYRFEYPGTFSEMLKSKLSTIKLPTDVQIIKPGKSIPEELAQFSGKWFGMDGGILEHVLVVEQIKDTAHVDAIYAWGEAPQWNVTPGWRRYKGTFSHGKLHLANGQISITYQLNHDGTILSLFTKPGIVAQVQLIKMEN